MITSTHRVVALIVVALVVALPSSGMAQRRDKAEAQSLLVFLQSVSVQLMARMCERGVPGYRQRFDNLYARWSAKHQARIARGETVFREALAGTDQPSRDRSKLEQIEKAIAELAQSPRETSPLALDDRWKSICEANLAELDAGIQP